MISATPSDFVLIPENPSKHINPFYICKHTVTQEEYERVMVKNPSDVKNPSNPVVGISFYDALKYCNRRSELEGFEKVYTKPKIIFFVGWSCDFSKNGYRLPTVDEWLWAASAADESKGYRYSGSDDIDKVAWWGEKPTNPAHPVMQKKPNELGLYDMSGNVWEWCWDRGRTFKGNTGRFAMGGCFCDDSKSCEVSSDYAFVNVPFGTWGALGFRITRSITSQ